MDAKEILARLKSGEIASVSSLETRDENKQVRSRLARIPWLKKEAKMVKRLLIPKELALPFNPETCFPDEQYNDNRKWRPFLSVSSAISVIKLLCQDNPELLEAYKVKTGVHDWDPTTEEVTQQDLQVFRHYISPRIFSCNATKVSMSTVTGNDYGASYSVEVERDPITEQLVGEPADWMRVAKLLNDLAYEENKHIEEVVSAAKSGKPFPVTDIKTTHQRIVTGNVAILNDENMRNIRTETRSKWCLVSNDMPHNFIIGIVLDLNGDMTPAGDLSKFTAEDIAEKLHLIRYGGSTSQLTMAIKALTEGNLKLRDIYPDFLELDMTCPQEGTKEQIGLGTTYGCPAVEMLKDNPGYAGVLKAVRDNLDTGWEDMEKRYLASCGIKPMTNVIEERILDALPDYLDITESPFCTAKVVKGNQEILNLLLTDEQLAELDINLGTLSAGILDEQEAAKEGRDLDMMSLLEEDGDDSEDGVVLIEATE